MKISNSEGSGIKNASLLHESHILSQLKGAAHVAQIVGYYEETAGVRQSYLVTINGGEMDLSDLIGDNRNKIHHNPTKISTGIFERLSH